MTVFWEWNISRESAKRIIARSAKMKSEFPMFELNQITENGDQTGKKKKLWHSEFKSKLEAWNQPLRKSLYCAWHNCHISGIYIHVHV